MGIRTNHSRFQSRFLFGHRWLAIPRDYLERRRYFRKISNVLMIVVLSIIVAGFIASIACTAKIGKDEGSDVPNQTN